MLSSSASWNRNERPKEGFETNLTTPAFNCQDFMMSTLVIGAGMCGLMCARDLQAAGNDVVVLDKGRGVGGRMATRRIGDAIVDHGAQFFTVRSEAFAGEVAEWTSSGLAYEWCRGFRSPADGYPRYAVRGGVTALAKHLARGLDIRLNTLAFAIRVDSSGVVVVLDDASELHADAVVSTCPLPQSYSLLSGAAEFPRDLLIDYHRTLGLLVVLDGPSAVTGAGAVIDDPMFSMIADNRMKGISTTSAVTFHANNEWSLANWDEPRERTETNLLAAARPWFGGANVVDQEVKRWRFATPQRLWPEPCWSNEQGSIVLAGDAFAGPNATASNLEGAYNSGRAAAARVLESR
jgi:renalase